jgi:hypothetical protein
MCVPNTHVWSVSGVKIDQVHVPTRGFCFYSRLACVQKPDCRGPVHQTAQSRQQTAKAERSQT